MKVKKVFIVWYNKDKVILDIIFQLYYKVHIRNKDRKIAELYSYVDNYPRKTIEIPHEYFSNKLI